MSHKLKLVFMILFFLMHYASSDTDEHRENENSLRSGRIRRKIVARKHALYPPSSSPPTASASAEDRHEPYICHVCMDPGALQLSGLIPNNYYKDKGQWRRCEANIQRNTTTLRRCALPCIFFRADNSRTSKRLHMCGDLYTNARQWNTGCTRSKLSLNGTREQYQTIKCSCTEPFCNVDFEHEHINRSLLRTKDYVPPLNRKTPVSFVYLDQPTTYSKSTNSSLRMSVASLLCVASIVVLIGIIRFIRYVIVKSNCCCKPSDSYNIERSTERDVIRRQSLFSDETASEFTSPGTIALRNSLKSRKQSVNLVAWSSLQVEKKSEHTVNKTASPKAQLATEECFDDDNTHEYVPLISNPGSNIDISPNV